MEKGHPFVAKQVLIAKLGPTTRGRKVASVVQWHHLIFPLFGGCPTKTGLPQKGFPVFVQGH